MRSDSGLEQEGIFIVPYVLYDTGPRFLSFIKNRHIFVRKVPIPRAIGGIDFMSKVKLLVLIPRVSNELFTWKLIWHSAYP